MIFGEKKLVCLKWYVSNSVRWWFSVLAVVTYAFPLLLGYYFHNDNHIIKTY